MNAGQQNELVKWDENKEYTRCAWPAGVYFAVVKEVQDGATGKHGLMKRLIFSVTNPADKQPQEIATAAYPRVTNKSRMGKIVQALGIKPGQEFKWQDLHGKPCKVFMKPETFKKNGVDVTQTCIQDVMPV